MLAAPRSCATTLHGYPPASFRVDPEHLVRALSAGRSRICTSTRPSYVRSLPLNRSVLRGVCRRVLEPAHHVFPFVSDPCSRFHLYSGATTPWPTKTSSESSAL